jgi:hypothetical protein
LPKTAQALAKWKGASIYLNGLKSLSPETAQALAKWGGNNESYVYIDHVMHLSGLEQISVEVAQALAQWDQGRSLYLDGLKKISVETAQALAGWNGGSHLHDLDLSGLEYLSVEVAQALANWERGWYLYLNGLKTVSQEVLLALSNSMVASLRLEGLIFLSEDSLVTLIKWDYGSVLLHDNFLFYPDKFNKELRVQINNIPTIFHRDHDGRFHCNNGPALALPDGYKIYAIHGIMVPDFVVEDPGSITFFDICHEENTELRRILIEKYGWDRYINSSGASIISQDEYGTLYRYAYGGDIISFVKVKNGTPEPDGSFKHYCIHVPPEIKTAHEAVAWTFGLTVDEYQPVMET